MKNRLLIAVGLTAVAALSLSACGTTEESSAGDTASASANSSAEPIVITDGSGATVNLDAPATKVVATEWNVVENLVSLGVAPVGVSDVKGYNTYSSTVPLTGTPKDIGTRGEPSVDTVAALGPDLIIVTTDLAPAAIKQLTAIAPILQIKPMDGTDQFKQMYANLDMIAKATGTEAKATEVENTFKQKLETDKAALATAGTAGAKVTFADGYVDANQAVIRPYTKTSLIGTVITNLGLEDAWTIDGDPSYGMGSTDVEGLTKLGDVDFFYELNAADGDDVFTEVLGKKNKVWQSLSFVKSGQVHRLPDGMWMFAGPATMGAYADAITAELTK